MAKPLFAQARASLRSLIPIWLYPRRQPVAIPVTAPPGAGGSEG